MFERKRMNKKGEIKQTKNLLTSQFPRIGRNGEITSFHLVALILAIAGFVVVLLLLFSLELDQFEEDEICKLSVLSRGTAPIGQGLIPLQCTTKKICVTGKTFGKGNCEQFNGIPKGDIINIKLEGKEAEDKAEHLSMLLAQGLYSCWSQMGEGKLDLFDGDAKISTIAFEGIFGTTGEKGTTCVICSRFAIAEDLMDEKNEKSKKILSQVDLAGYMNKHGPKGGTGTYLQLLTDKQVVASQNEISDALKITEDVAKTDEIAFVFSQILVNKDPKDAAFKAATRTTVVIGGALFFSPAGKVSNFLGVSLVGKAVGTAIVGLTSGGISYFNAGKNLEVMASQCAEFKKEGDDRAGCSLVRPFDFNKAGEINAACGAGIQGNP